VIKNGRESTANHRVVILSYDLCIRMTAQLQAFKVIIVDESHMLKNKNAKRTQTIVPLVKVRVKMSFSHLELTSKFRMHHVLSC
jgi:SWI/SNF-related matrix-associated actin-dependent regulator 1 of chromatin subfamily A